ncbi:MAG: 50S ribosomal protein L2 [Candidatus Kerfeldbacteria bacterium RIFCSPLOWO2_01_FULL_48_11]|uniref:Large ribosomal subunit protein uL2 n=1 Tax=Candidatus Kerfeldbacteria bacterium RIFCSPLOWO2_01_FULL_48_11 TaxID=1798543 RepID=A0A1G2B5F4_9BACT|nr:MAG: 50S ribosomal protein L2 [Parcubacteria group bacterium GW2011_GWA2_48_9]KKW13590.1 MAG: 50S ribosomal protein L2 [Parcubacteria group bacterium GW2011_GWC2_49_9]OGY84372.1 MAG: 50S ribosomal protein L2 [Candidatus Kerfeldbacteria bacterium RIFCSPLOWO2_01_FULL_48_11]
MTLKLYNPTTPGRRHASVIKAPQGSKSSHVRKSLRSVLPNHAGRNGQGKITVRHRGGRNKRFYRKVDFLINKLDAVAHVESIEYDPNRTAHIALVKYPDGEYRYILAPATLKIGDMVVASKESAELKPGNRLPLAKIPVGMSVYNLELFPGRGGEIVRSAGSSAVLMSMEGPYAQVKLPSGEVRMFSRECMATIGQASNIEHENVRLGKAGRSRWRGVKPTVRGKAMNPVDHPHGGGEGHNPIGLKHPKTPWGKPALGVKTRKLSMKSDRFIIHRRSSK